MKSNLIKYLTVIVIIFTIISCKKEDGSETNQSSPTSPISPTSSYVVINDSILNINLYKNETYNLFATTYSPVNTPSYSWNSSNPDVVSITVSDNNAIAIITVIGTNGEYSTITVTDNANSLTYSIIVNVKEHCPKKVLIENFCAHLCVNCPRADNELDSIINIYGDKIIPICLHVSSMAQPSNPPFDVDYRTTAGNEIDNNFGVSASGIPNGMINRTEYNGDIKISDSDWLNVAEEIMYSYSNIFMEINKVYSQTNRTIDINIKSTFLSDINSNLKLVVLITENGLISGQYIIGGNGADTEYVHNHVLRDAISLPMGDVIGSTSILSGDVIESNYTYTLNSEWNDNNCNIITYIYDSNTNEVLQAEMKAVK